MTTTQFKHFIIKCTDLNLTIFKAKFIDNLDVISTYSIIIKLCCAEEEVYKMIGRQVGFQLTEKNTELLYNTILSRVDMYSSLYGLEHTIRSIDIMYKVIALDSALTLKNVNKLKLDRKLVKVTETKQNFSFK